MYFMVLVFWGEKISYYFITCNAQTYSPMDLKEKFCHNILA